MKTTIELPDGLFKEAKRLAARQDTTLKELIVSGLRRVLSERKQPETFELRDARFRGRGLQPRYREAQWEDLRDAIYEQPQR